jgi:hypothetical protein
VTGFAMYGAAGGDSHKYYDPGSHAGSYHDLDEEARLFSAILASLPAELQVTPEVGDVLKRHGHGRRLQDTADAEGADSLSLYHRLLGRLAWRLLRAGFKLRRKFEEGTSTQFNSLKR